MPTSKVRYVLCLTWPDGRMRLHGLWTEQSAADTTAVRWQHIFNGRRELDTPGVVVTVQPVYPSTASWRDHGHP